MTVADAVYVLCALTSFACFVLLARGYRDSRTPLLLWSSLCFAGLFLSNVLLIVDVRLIPSVDLRVVRQLPALVGVALLVYGLIWHGDDR